MAVLLASFAISAYAVATVENAMLSVVLEFLWLLLTFIFLILRHGEILKRLKLWIFFKSIKFVGYNRQTPKYQGTEAINQYLDRVRFHSRIHAKDWERQLHEMEMFFKAKIHKAVASDRDIRTMDIHIVREDLPKLIPWCDSDILDGPKFAIGRSYEGLVEWDLKTDPHATNADSSGRGKTNCLRYILRQAILKTYEIVLIDMKGGGDYYGLDNVSGAKVISDPETARDVLVSLLTEVRERMAEFKRTGAANVGEYNSMGRYKPKNRILLAIDEAAELLDVKPRDKADKELYIEFDQTLRTLARMSRAAGVHLLLEIIRPDATILDGQIKNNLTFRVCFYLPDAPASRIVLENDKATQLSPDIKGRAIVGEDETQTYFLPVSKWLDFSG